MSRRYIFVIWSIILVLCSKAGSVTYAGESNFFYQNDFSGTRCGAIPEGWRDLINIRPNRNWAVDSKGIMRPMLKKNTGLVVYDGGMKSGVSAAALTDTKVVAKFQKTEDESVSFGIVSRVIDRDNYYLARFCGSTRLELIKVKNGCEQALDSVEPAGGLTPRPTGMVVLDRYRESEQWALSLTVSNKHLSASVFDANGREQAHLESVDGEFKQGNSGLCCTTFSGASSFYIEALRPFRIQADGVESAQGGTVHNGESQQCSIIQPYWKTEEIDTPREKVAGVYDVVISGAGTGGWAAAVQAARLGARVLLLEETDWIGGQMSCAGVTTMDEDSVWMKFPVRERGIYREFHESMAVFYQSLNKDPFVAYYGYPDQLEGGYEPKVTRAVLYGFIQDVRGQSKTLDLSLRTHVVSVQKSGNSVTGVTVEFQDEDGTTRKNIACKVLVDATEYGDIIPLTGARYRVGNTTSDHPDMAALVQDHTWTAILREYPDGVPEHLQIKEPPPGYETGSGRRYRNYTRDGMMLWGAAGQNIKGRRNWRVYFAWRGMSDSDSPLTGERSRLRHTQCGVNGGNDYQVTAGTIEEIDRRLRDEREGIYKTLGVLYYFQQELGVNWSLAEDEGYDTFYNREKMKKLNLRPDLEKLAVYLPQQPYVRECRRIMGVETLVAKDLTRFEKAKHVTTSVAMGDYFMDLDHGETSHAVETDLDPVDSGELPRGGGPFQVPFEVFIPEKIDGFIPAEKNISQSRLANGATRLQPITMLTGQAAGTIAALSVKQRVQPRNLNPLTVQSALLQAGSTLIQRWYSDVPWGTPVWRATQLLSLYQVMDRSGDIDRRNEIPLGSTAYWGVDKVLDGKECGAVLQKLAQLKGKNVTQFDNVPDSVSVPWLINALELISPDWKSLITSKDFADRGTVTAGEFAVIAARILTDVE